MRRGPIFYIGMIVVACVLLVATIVLCSRAVSGPSTSPPPQRVSVVQPWCIDPVAMTMLDDVMCAQDLDGDGFVDGHLYVPLPGLVRPARGAKLPPQVNLGQARVVRVPVQAKPRPSVPPRVVGPPAAPAAPLPKRTVRQR